MGWPDPIKNKQGKIIGYRGRYRDADGVKQVVRDEAGKPKVFGRKSDAKQAANEKETQARRRAAVPTEDASPALANMFWGDWWDQIAIKREFPNTDTGAKEASIVKLYVRPRWGSVPLNKIKHSEAKGWVEDLKAGNVENWTRSTPPSPNYVHTIWTVFSASITMAVEAGVLDASPCAGMKNLPRVPKRPKPYIGQRAVGMMSQAGLRADYEDAIKFILETGLRPGELCGLHASSIDLDRCWMLVADVFVTRRKVVRPYTKNGDVRWVPLTPRALEIIDRRLDSRSRVGGCGVPHTDETECDSVLVFRTERRKPMKPGSLTHMLKNAAEAAGLPRSAYSGYGGRRGFATAAADGGLDPFALKGILGHSSLDMVLEYVQQTPWARERLLVALGARPEGLALDGPQLTVLPGGASGAAPGAHLPRTMQDHAGPAMRESHG